MTKLATKPSPPRTPDAFNSEYIDSATLHLDGVIGLLYLLQTTLEPKTTELTNSEAVGITKIAQSLTVWAYDELAKDKNQSGRDWTTVMQWLDGVRGALVALKGGYLGDYDLPNNRIQIAATHSLQAVISEAMTYMNRYGDESGGAA